MDLELLDWLENYTFPAEAKYENPEYALKTYQGFVDRMVKSATTRACIFATIHVEATLILMELLEEGKICTLADSQYVLVEFDPMTEYSYLRDGILKLDSYGYIPILAHTERYECLFQKKERLQRVKDHGGLIQVNAASFQGGMFDEMAKRAKYIMKNDLLDFVGTDAHSTGKRKPAMKDTASYLCKKLGKEKAEEILVHNPGKVLGNR